MPSTNMSKVPPGGRCDSDKGSGDGIGDGPGAGEGSNSPDGAGFGEPSDSADEIPSDSGLLGRGLPREESRPLIMSRIDPHLCFGIADEAIARRRRTIYNYIYISNPIGVLFVAACPTCVFLTVELLIIHSVGDSCENEKVYCVLERVMLCNIPEADRIWIRDAFSRHVESISPRGRNKLSTV